MSYEIIDLDLLRIEMNNLEFNDSGVNTLSRILDDIEEHYDDPIRLKIISSNLTLYALYNTSITKWQMSFVTKLSQELYSRIKSLK